MRRFWRRDLKTFSILLGAFAFIGLASTWTLYSLMSERIWHDARTELLTLARLISLQVDGDQHEKLFQAEQMDSPLYASQNQRLAIAKAQAPGIRFVYTLKQIDGENFFILDPTPPGDADNDGVEDKSDLMELYDESDPYLDRAMSSGAPLVADEIYTDKWGSFISAYAPILASDGRTVAMLGVDYEAGNLNSSLADVRQRSLLGFFLSLLAGFVFATILSHQGSKGSPNEKSSIVRAFRRNGGIRIHVVGIGIVACTMVTGACGYLLMSHRGSELKELDRRAIDLHAIRSGLERILFEKPAAEQARQWLKQEGAYARFGTLRRVRDQWIESDSSGIGRDFRRILDQVHAEQSVLIHDREQFTLEGAGAQRLTAAALLLAVGLSLGAFVLVRFAQRQQRSLVETKQAAERAETDYQHLVESLPIGFFRFHDGEITYSNVAFDLQVDRAEGQSATGAFFEALSSIEQSEPIIALHRAESARASFETFYALPGPHGDLRYYESKGVPVFDSDGAYSHMVCFNLDVTGLVQATANLQQRSNEIQATNERLQATLAELETNFSAMVMAFVKAIEAKDPYTAGHSERVMRYSVAIAEAAGLPIEEIEMLRKAALVHDVGKIGIADGILTKPDRLTAEEFDVIKRHVTIGADMIAAIPLFRDCVPVVRWHHERLDGSGYPDGLADEGIPTTVRIAAVADAFDAMTSTRAYRKGMDMAKALEELRSDVQKGRLDGKFVELLADIVCTDQSFVEEDRRSAA